jgi:polyhydroxyalkanoate synthesis repressor PhaR
MPEKREQRVIKRYANRKLYDMSASCYITRDEIASLVEAGEEVKIIDNRTREDITNRTLTQILIDKEKTHRKALPMATLRGMFQSGGDFFAKNITQPVSTLRDEAEETVRKVLRPKTDTLAEAVDEPIDTDQDRQKPAEGLREFFESSQHAVDNLQRTLEERWNLVVQSLGHLDVSNRKVAELEARVAELEKQVADLKRLQ